MIALLYLILSFLISITIYLFNNKVFSKTVSVLYALIHAAFTGYAWMHLGETELDFFTFDKVGVLLLSVLSILIFPTLYHGFIYTKSEKSRKHTIYHTSIILFLTSITGAYLANGITVTWIFVEATTLSVVYLIYHDRSALALEATWKYIFVCSIGIALAYIGILFLGITVSGSKMLPFSYTSVAQFASQANPLYLKITFIFVLVGYSTKFGLFPMHTVSIDAHTVAPPPVSAVFSTALKSVGFIAIFRVFVLFSGTTILPFMRHVLILVGFLSILIAAGYTLKAKHNLRMLAYSSMENMGIIAIALGIGGVAYYAVFLHLILHSFTKAGLFFQMGQSQRVMKTYMLDDSGDYMRLFPAGGAALLLGLLCITAIPPSGLFISEVAIFKSMINSGNYFYLIIFALLICFIVYALSTRVLHILYSQPRNRESFKYEHISPIETISQFVLFGTVMFICFYQPKEMVAFINSIIIELPK